MAKKLYYTHEEMLDMHLGTIGTPERDEYERKMSEAIQASHVGEALKQAREAQHLTQAELGERVGVQRSQIGRMERGQSLPLTAVMRVLRALGLKVLDVQGVGRVALA